MRLYHEELEPVFAYAPFDRLQDLMLVCRRWRNVIVSSPRLWSELRFSIDVRRPTPATLALFLDRSKAAPLKLRLTLPPTSWPDICAKYWSAIAKHIGHMVHLFIDHAPDQASAWRDEDVHTALVRSAPRLAVFAISSTFQRPLALPHRMFNEDPGALTSVRLRNVIFPRVIPPAWTNIIEFLYADISVPRSGLLALLHNCPSLQTINISIGRNGYDIDCEPGGPIVAKLDTVLLSSVVDPTAFLIDIHHDAIRSVHLEGGTQYIMPSWTVLSEHVFTSACILSYFSTRMDGFAQMELLTESGMLRRAFPVPVSQIYENLYDAAFFSRLVSIEIAEDLWPMTKLPVALHLETLTFVVCARLMRSLDMSMLRSNFHLNISKKKLGRLHCPKLRTFVLAAQTRVIDQDPGEEIPPEEPVLSAHRLEPILDKLSTSDGKLDALVLRGIKIDDLGRLQRNRQVRSVRTERDPEKPEGRNPRTDLLTPGPIAPNDP